MTMRSPHLINILCTVVLLLLSGCGEKTEQEQYEAATSGITYHTYKSASALAVPTSVKLYNQGVADSLHLRADYVHLLLGYGWSLSKKSSLAFAEAALAGESEDATVRFLAQTVRSITMYQEGWHTLAKTESAAAKQHLTGQPGAASYEAAIFYLLMGSVYAKEKDFEQARFFWAGFGEETDIHWPYQLCDAAADFQAGRIQPGLQKVKVMSQDPHVPEPLRAALGEQITRIEKEAGTSVDSSLFWPQMIGKILWDELKKATSASIRQVMDVTSELQKGMPGQ